MRRSLLLLLPLTLAACGSSQKHVASPPPVSVHLYGRGATRVWVFAPAATPKLIVLYVHASHQQARGDAVLPPAVADAPRARRATRSSTPAYDTFPYQAGGFKHLIQGVAVALPHVAKGVPVAAIGDSRAAGW